MALKKYFILIIIAAIFFAVYRNYTFFRNRKTALSQPVSEESNEDYEEQSGEDQKKNSYRRELSPAVRIQFSSGIGRDPFGFNENEKTIEKYSDDNPPLQQFQLTAVLLSPYRRFALLNGEIFQEGDTIAGRRLEKIEPDRILLSGGGDGWVIDLQQGQHTNIEENTL